MNFRLTALVLFMFTGCRGWEAVLISSDDFVPMLNVTAVLSPDGGGEVTVLVQRLLPLDGPLTTDEVVNDTTWYIMHETGVSAYYVISRNRSRHEVMDAIVTLSDGSNTYYLEYENERGFGAGSRAGRGFSRYVPQDTTFVPLPGVTYTLNIETPDGLSVTGTTTVPLLVGLDSTVIPDSLAIRDPIPMRWQRSTGYYIVSAQFNSDRGTEGVYCVANQSVAVLGDTSWTLDALVVDSCPVPGVGEMAYDFMVAAIDSNYYNYFVRDPSEQGGFTFLLLGEGAAGAAHGIEGGLGVFGSYRFDSITRLIAL